jgi:hypothetical protein
MKKSISKQIIFYALTIFLFTQIFSGCKTQQSALTSANFDTLVTNPNGQGIDLKIEFIKGPAHNHPTLVFWLEDMSENYIQTLYITKSIANGVFEHVDASSGQWKSGKARRPAALPYWSHKRGIKADDDTYLPTPENPVPDAYTGATPKNNFIIKTRTDKRDRKKFRVLLEINQTWDWNEYWTNNKYPDNQDYKTSCQPSLIYAVSIDLNSPVTEYHMNPIGHGHYAGENGQLYTDLNTLTTAKQIAEKIIIKIQK